MAKIRKETTVLDMYMEASKDGDIREDADGQRERGQWTNEQINELIVTVLKDGYIPPIFIGEDLNKQKWLLDGLQRTTSLKMYRYGNYKITSVIRNSVIPYREKARDENGKLIEDENGDYVWNECEFDIKNKTYDDLPEELKRKFNKFHIDTVIFEECTMSDMSDLILIYNNHTSMNASQKAATYISEFSRNVKNIVKKEFFVNHSNFTEKEKIKGVIERVVLETVMCMYHLDKWKKQPKQIASYLNENSSKSEFEKLSNNINRLENIITDETKHLFNSKDSFILLTLFERFTKLNINDKKFAEFLKAFNDGLKNKEVDGTYFDKVDQSGSTKDKSVIVTKLHILETLMNEFLLINKEDLETVDYKEFVKANVEDIIDSDIYEVQMVANDISEVLDSEHWMLSEQNYPAYLALVGMAFRIEVEDKLKEWLPIYVRNNQFILNQQKAFLHMKQSFEDYLQKGVAA